jgi:hypothetical protein
MKSCTLWLTTIVVIATASAALRADSITLRSGKRFEGSLLSSDTAVMRFRLANGVVVEFPIEDVTDVRVTPRATPRPRAPDPSRAPAPVTVPAGSVLNVRLTEAIDVDVAAAGAVYRSVLDDPVMIDGDVVIPRGARVALQAVAVKQSGKLKGSDKITLKASTLSFGGVTYDLATTYVQTKGSGEGKRTAKKVGIGAGLGAAFGGIFGGGSGAAIGAVIGGSAGAVVASQESEHLRIPPETRLQFQLNAALTVGP